ncbi:alpha/beta hydrolase [Variovorax sp. OV329]|uniref:alpha/beta hydrolase n=1 Tax=Variovorax sp. OV329 TaxID=1882825 RepID=UPI0008E7AEB5|nr:alpha/beta fold hydrolase [Variovorax sp. OV329]SFM77440.1 Alpha/beta hydrolase family protein [Variovorax sp. OV329]
MTETVLHAPASRYYDASPGIRVFRLALGAAQRLWPALAVRAAYRLFGTPLPLRWLRGRSRWDAHWRIESWPFESAGLTLYAPADAPLADDAPTALLVHGWGGHAAQMRPLAEALLEQGLRPVILEMPAHGRSAGSNSNLPQFTRAIEYAAARLQQQGHALQVAVAHSMGANALAHAASRDLDVPRLVLLAPPASPFEFTRMFAHVFGLRESIRAAMQRRIEAREGILMSRFEPAAVGPRIDARTLVVHDRGDAVNRFADGEAFTQAIAGARLVATEGLGHRRLLQDAQVLRQVTEFAAAPRT